MDTKALGYLLGLGTPFLLQLSNHRSLLVTLDQHFG
jgi:hypothetical protein